MLSMNHHISEYDILISGEEGDLFKALEESGQQLLDKAFYEWEQDLMMKSATESPQCGVLDIKNIVVMTMAATDESQGMQKSVNFANLSSMDWSHAH
ncbi:hypothetical protein Bca52824_016340 [Brassica carinata]|uniref:Uncharacterized protein n=1 Tax=Brassica carinata TaxID=52824 RepID=A0A8X8B6J1_BRACI|nr:hypothetical protein Bca52824_016340 [Brassica carinata]